MEPIVLSFQSGQLHMQAKLGYVAKQATQSIWLRAGHNIILTTVTMAREPREGIDYFPLLVDFEDRMYAIGKFPGGFFKREGRPSEEAILLGRKADRALRPRFPEEFRRDVQIVFSPLSIDRNLELGVLAINSASLALHISEIPYEKPVAAVRVGRIGSRLVLNPTNEQIEDSDFDLVVAGTYERVNMIELEGYQVPEEVVLEAITFGHEEIKRLVEQFEQVRQELGKPKVEYEAPPEPPEEIKQRIFAFVEEEFGKRYPFDQKQDVFETRRELSEQLKNQLAEELGEEAEEKLQGFEKVFDKAVKKFVREQTLSRKVRVDGRSPEEIRPLALDVGLLPRAHGSGLFTRGQTQVLTSLTLGTISDQQKIDTMYADDFKRFMHHYNFPPYCVGEVKPIRAPSRREIGHGALVEKSLAPVIPSEEEFPYTIRLVSEVLESNASSSMASVCASTLALMDGGVPIKAPVAGISIGLMWEGDDRYVLLTDISGFEDFNGDMDFKIAGTKRGITGIQLDVKIEGLSHEILAEALERAKVARLEILHRIRETIAMPRPQLSPFAPKMVTLQIDPLEIGIIIGPGGRTIKQMEMEYECSIDIQEDGTIFVAGHDPKKVQACIDKIEQLTAEIEIGQEYEGRVVKIMPFGAFVNLGRQDGLLHISKVAPYRVEKVEDVLKVGDIIKVRVAEIDDRGRINLERVDLDEVKPPKGGDGRGQGRRPAHSHPRGGGHHGGGRHRPRH